MRLSETELACLEAVRHHGESQASAVVRLAIQECERRCDANAQAGDEDFAAHYAHALWQFDQGRGGAWSGRPPIKPTRAQVWDRWPELPEVHLAEALTAAWRAAGQHRSVAALMMRALVRECEAVAQGDTLPLPPGHPALLRCTEALQDLQAFIDDGQWPRQRRRKAAGSGTAPAAVDDSHAS